ncbi:DUF4286 family protein [Plebeiibacterium marinum]|uniref:DUF4286 family protein n=1 Tax=Plebeiibacterium marinum TaxID=2992111 RepID=A0AAE3SJ77_9BACT|nr:DUF4286 family protein [Plebeiobacterium marinum]MCW3805149.1 DUF4286 family protein [Plebeiobacterium marinum]
MFIFNTTFVVSQSKFDKWLVWLKNTYTPLIKNIVPASEVGIFEVMSTENPEEKTISVQWKVATPTELEVINRQSPVVLGQMSSDFGNEILYFSSILKSL